MVWWWQEEDPKKGGKKEAAKPPKPAKGQRVSLGVSAQDVHRKPRSTPGLSATPDPRCRLGPLRGLEPE